MLSTMDHPHKINRMLAIVQAIHTYDETLNRYLDFAGRAAEMIGDPKFDRGRSHAEADHLAAERALYRLIGSGRKPVVYAGHAYVVDHTHQTVNRIDVQTIDGRELV